MTELRTDRSWSMQVTALYDYKPEQPDELHFEEGDVLRVVHVQDDGWWSGFNVEEPDVVGLFPSNYVQAQRTVRSTKASVDATQQRIQQQPQQAPDTPELESEDEGDEDTAQELRSEFRGHVGTVLQLRKNLENAERAREAARDARRKAERERLRHRKSWREREQDEDQEIQLDEVKYSQANPQQQEAVPVDGEDTEDEDDSAFPHVQGSIHEADQQEDEEEAEEVKPDRSLTVIEENETQSDVEYEHTSAVESAAAVVIARNYRRHTAIVQRKQALKREAEQHREVAAVCIQRWAAHAHSRQRQRRQLEQSTARRRRQQENDAASVIQKWIRLRWACFWRTRVQVEREQRAVKEAQQLEEMRRQEELELQRRQEAESKRQLAQVEEERRALEEQLRQKLEVDAQQLQLKVVEEEVQRRFLEENDVSPAVSSPDAQAGKTRRKVMKKEAVELIKTLVQQQLGETLRDHDTKMDELQRMVSRLQTVVRKQTAMLEDSTDELVALQMKRQEQKLPMPPVGNGAGSYSLLPRISAPRQPVAPSGLRAPRPVMLSKLPVIANGVRGSGFNQKKL
ncbi:hypothetical protein V7S43_015416 [Phytophthora oleae]|uniref:SH3 domain-containing protein n=1 Tax=Phytophthora oleae TaxID=2107226 RepID=A0ABD3EYX2_9STRA